MGEKSILSPLRPAPPSEFRVDLGHPLDEPGSIKTADLSGIRSVPDRKIKPIVPVGQRSVNERRI